MAIAILGIVGTLLELISKSEVAKEVDHHMAQELIAIHARVHALRERLHGKIHKAIHNMPKVSL